MKARSAQAPPEKQWYIDTWNGVTKVFRNGYKVVTLHPVGDGWIITIHKDCAMFRQIEPIRGTWTSVASQAEWLLDAKLIPEMWREL